MKIFHCGIFHNLQYTKIQSLTITKFIKGSLFIISKRSLSPVYAHIQNIESALLPSKSFYIKFTILKVSLSRTFILFLPPQLQSVSLQVCSITATNDFLLALTFSFGCYSHPPILLNTDSFLTVHRLQLCLIDAKC